MTWAQSKGVTDVSIAGLDANYQVGPMLELLSGHFGPDKAEPGYRLDASHLVINAEKQIDVVPEEQLLAQMKEYKEGTMFAVFMCGTKPEESHWAFAEVRDEFVGAGVRQPIIVFRDFQQNIPFKGKITKETYTTKASITVDQLPLGCKADTKVFVSGAFIALEPTFETFV